MVTAAVIAGTPLAPVMVLLVSDPLFGPNGFFLIWGVLGWEFAVARPLAAVVLGLTSGVLVEVLSIRARPASASTSPQGCRVDTLLAPSASAVTEQQPPVPLRPFWGGMLQFSRIVARTALKTGKPVLLALIVQALLLRYVPSTWISATVGANPTLAVLWAAAVGIPLYVNAPGAIPLLQGLVELGMDKGAILAFLISGPVTSMSTMVAVLYLLGWRFLVLYVSVGFLGAVAFGYGFQWY